MVITSTPRKKHHPDTNKTDPDAKRRFQQIADACAASCRLSRRRNFPVVKTVTTRSDTISFKLFCSRRCYAIGLCGGQLAVAGCAGAGATRSSNTGPAVQIPNRRSTPGASGSIMETLPSGRIAGKNGSSSVVSKIMALHTDRVSIRNRSKFSFETTSTYTKNI